MLRPAGKDHLRLASYRVEQGLQVLRRVLVADPELKLVEPVEQQRDPTAGDHVAELGGADIALHLLPDEVLHKELIERWGLLQVPELNEYRGDAGALGRQNAGELAQERRLPLPEVTEHDDQPRSGGPEPFHGA